MLTLKQQNQQNLPADYLAVRGQVMVLYYKFLEAGQLDFAEQVCRKLLAVANDWRVRDHLLELLHKQGRQLEALHEFEVVARQLPLSPLFDAIYPVSMKAVNACPMPMERRWRFASLLEMLQATDGLPGDTVECGCYRGLSSHLICSLIRELHPGFDGRGHHIIDSFQGLSQPGKEDQVLDSFPDAARIRKMSKAGSFSASYADVLHNLADFPGIHYCPGWVPEVLPQVDVTECRFVHLDLDLYEPTLAALHWFWPKLVSGGCLVCDDYNWPGGRRAVDEFCAAQGIEPTITEYGQAVLAARPAHSRINEQITLARDTF